MSKEDKPLVMFFGEGTKDMKDLLGGKGANLSEMTRIGIPVPPGFTITTEVCRYYYAHGEKYPENLKELVDKNLKRLEEVAGRKFGDPEKPLLVSVRSGAKISMPGMMDTILNLGLNDQSVEGLAKETNDPRFAWDSYRRFIQMFGNVVMGVKMEKFHEKLEAKKEKYGVKYDYELSPEALKELVEEYKQVYKEETGEDFPQDPYKQLWMAIEAVIKSWNNKRAIDYRNHMGIPHDLGTAVNIQMMVFGNMGDDSGTGVCFTRNPSNGNKELYGEFLPNAQGEDVVAGIRTPYPIEKLKEMFPDVYEQLKDTAEKLERHFKDMQDIEFTIMKGKLYLLQTRNGKRTGLAAVKIAHDMVQEGLIDKEEAILRIKPQDVEFCMFPRINWENPKKHTVKIDGKIVEAPLIGKGLPAGPGAATGAIVFDSDKAEEMKKENPDVSLILVRNETSPEDFHGMVASDAIVTIRGGITSHAAIVSRQLGKTCVVGCEASGMRIRKTDDGYVLVGQDGTTLKEGDIITVDGFEGRIYKGRLPVSSVAEMPPELETVLDWADSFAKLKVRTNADKPDDTATAFKFKAVGTGLARTEHQFFEKERLPIVQDMILAETEEEREKYLAKLLEFQRTDFEGLFKVAEGKPITIRLIDPPLHEFLPKKEELEKQIKELEETGGDPEKLAKLKKMLLRVMDLHEANPMLGLRGCRLGITMPGIIRMQVRAIIEAALNVKSKGIEVHPEIMVPLVGFPGEFKLVRKIIDETAEQVMKERKHTIDYKVGTMIEVPRAALAPEEIVEGEKGAEFLSFGTNDLHQMTLGISRDDAGKFLPYYIEHGIIEVDPFISIDQGGVGRLMKLCVENARKVRPDVKIGICGEHGGDPVSIEFCHNIGLDYVSCSPFRVPVARLAAAHAALKNKN